MNDKIDLKLIISGKQEIEQRERERERERRRMDPQDKLVALRLSRCANSGKAKLKRLKMVNFHLLFPGSLQMRLGGKNLLLFESFKATLLFTKANKTQRTFFCC